MEKLRVACPACGRGILVPPEHAGRKGTCPQCGAEVQIPLAPAPAGEAAPSPEAQPASEPAREEAPEGMARALAVAAGAALLGAVGWAAVLRYASYELGWLAWGIGAGVGWSAVRAGARGPAPAVVAAALTVLSIFGGKLLGYALRIHADTREAAGQQALAHEEYRTDAADWAALPGGGRADVETVRAFMTTHEYSSDDGEPPADEEVAWFRSEVAPMLEWFHAEQPTPEEFADYAAADMRAQIYADSSLASLVLTDLEPVDALFVFFGLSTAFGLVKRAGRPRSD